MGRGERVLAWWRALAIIPQLLLLTIPVASALVLVLLHRYPGRGMSVGIPGFAPLAAWTWLLCPLTGLMILRALLPRDSLSPRAMLTGLLAGMAWPASLRLLVSLLACLPLWVRANVPVGWDFVWWVAVTGMVVGTPLLAYWAGLQERTPDSLPRWLRLLWRTGDRATNPVYRETVAWAWALSALVVLQLIGLLHTSPATAAHPAAIAPLVVAVAALTAVALAGFIASTLAGRFDQGPYAVTGAYCGALAAVLISVSVWRPGLALAACGLLLLVALTAAGGAIGYLVHRGATVGSPSFDRVAACVVGLAVIVLGFAMTPALQTNSILSLAREGRNSRLAVQTIGRLRGPAGARTLLELIELPQERMTAAMYSPGPPPPSRTEGIADIGNLVKAADTRLTELGTSEPMLLLSLLPKLQNGERAFLIERVGKARAPRLVPALLNILAGKLPPPPQPRLPKLPRPRPSAGPGYLYHVPYLGSWLMRRSMRSATASSTFIGPGGVWSGGMVPISVSSGGPDEVRAAAARVLGGQGDRQAVQPLIGALTARPPVCGAAAQALVQLQDPAAAEPLRRLLMADDPQTRRAAAAGMRVFRYRPAVPELLALLRTEHDDQSDVVQALADLGVREALPQFKTLLATTNDDETGRACCEALEKLGASPLEPLVQLSLRHDVPWWARMRLREKYRSQATARLVPLLNDPAQVAAAAEALRWLDTDEGRAALSKHGLAVSAY